MFDRNVPQKNNESARPREPVFSQALIEALEDRRMLSGSVVYHAVHHAVHHATAKHAALKHHTAKAATTAASSNTTAPTSNSTGTSTSSGTSGSADGLDPGSIVDTITFSQAPTAVQTGLKTLATTDSLTAPTSTQTVYLGNRNGVESYTLDYSTSGTTTHISVDQNGNPITAATQTTTTWATLSGTGAGSNAAAAAEITAIAAALGLTAPTPTTLVYVSAVTGAPAIYTVHLSNSSTTTTSKYPDGDGGSISVNANGDPVGDQSLPFSVIPTPIQNGFNHNLPTGATALGPTSTQNVQVRTIQGVTLYSTTFTSSGTSTTVTVNSIGVLTSLPTESTASFSDLPVAVQDELQTLATADGFSGTIGSSQTVSVYKESNGTLIYSITVSATNSSSQSVTLTLSVDQNGNPTLPPGGGGCGGGGHAFDDGIDNLLTGGWGGADFGLASFGGRGH